MKKYSHTICYLLIGLLLLASVAPMMATTAMAQQLPLNHTESNGSQTCSDYEKAITRVGCTSSSVSTCALMRSYFVVPKLFTHHAEFQNLHVVIFTDPPQDRLYRPPRV